MQSRSYYLIYAPHMTRHLINLSHHGTFHAPFLPLRNIFAKVS